MRAFSLLRRPLHSAQHRPASATTRSSRGLGLAAAVISSLVGLALVRGDRSNIIVGISLADSGAIVFGVLCFLIGAAAIGGFGSGDFSLYCAGFAARGVAAVVLMTHVRFDDEIGLIAEAAEGGYVPYGRIVAALFRLFPSGLLLPRMLNVLLGTLLAFSIQRLAAIVCDDANIARRALHIALFAPPLVVYSAVALKEIPTAFLITLAVRAALDEAVLIRRMVSIGTPLLFLAWFRGLGWLLIGLMAVMLAVVPRALSSARIDRRHVGVIGAATALVAWPVWSRVLQQYITPRLQNEYFALRFQSQAQRVASLVNPYSPLAFMNWVILTSRAIYSPSPLRMIFDFDPFTSLEMFSSAAFYMIMPLALIGMASPGRPSGANSLALSSVGLFTVTASGMAFGADPARHRIVAVPFLIVLAAIGAERPWSRRQRMIWGGWWIGAIAFTMLYLRVRY